MDAVLKKGVVILLVLFFGFWLVQDPTGFADSAKSLTTSVWDLLVKLFDAVISFARSLSN